jgi:hypothetical protein
LGNNSRRSIVLSSTSRSGSENSHYEFLSRNSAEIWNGRTPLSETFEISPIEINIFKIIQRSTWKPIVPVVVGLDLIEVDCCVCEFDNWYEVIESTSGSVGIRNSDSLINGNIFRTNNNKLSLCRESISQGGSEGINHISDLSGCGVISFNVKIDTI